MNIVVTGAKGQVGQEVMLEGPALLIAMNIDAKLIGFDSSELDISDYAQVQSALNKLQPAVVINAAAYTAVDKAESEPEKAHAVNAIGPANLAKMCKQMDNLLIHISTDYVFDGKSSNAYLETDSTSPASTYGTTKRDGEQAILEFAEKFHIVRVAWVFGAYGNNFVKTMLRLGKERDALSIVGDQVGAPTWAKDIAKTLIQMAAKRLAPYGIYHFTGDRDLSWFEFAKVIFTKAKALGLLSKIPQLAQITTSDYPTPAKRPSNSRLDCEKINKQLGINRSNWDAGLDNVLTQWKMQ